MTDNIEHLSAYLETIINNIPQTIFCKDKDSVFLWCNEVFAKFAGLNAPEEIIGKTDYDLPWAKTESDAYIADDQMVIKSKKPKLNIEETQTLKDGRKIVLLTSKVPLLDDQGNVTSILCIYSDITEHKNAEEREKLAIAQASAAQAKAKTEAEMRQAVMILTGSVVHDLRTPLASISMLADSMQQSLNEIEHYHGAELESLTKLGLWQEFQHLFKFPGRLKQLAHDMQEFISASLKTLSRALFKDLTQDDLTLCDSYHCLHNILLRYPFLDHERELIHWDQSYRFNFYGNQVLFFRVIFNLLKNSLYQIQQHGKGQIFIHAEDGGAVNLLKIRDTAGGVTPEIAAHLFDGYFTTKQEGTGVGLAFCKMILQSFGGDIVCHSTEGDFIEFVLSFPKV